MFRDVLECSMFMVLSTATIPMQTGLFRVEGEGKAVETEALESFGPREFFSLLPPL